MEFTELHFHLLPGLDDGPADIEASLELARAAVDDGTDTIVCTPHVNNVCRTDVLALEELVEELTARLREAGLALRVRTGGELAPEALGRLTQLELEAIAQGPAGRRWLLLEAPLDGLDQGFAAAADELRERGFAVVMAHPERSLVAGAGGWPVLERELEAGTPMQVNAWSLAGVYGEEIRGEAFRVLERAPRTVIASDAHGPHRPPSLQLALRALREAGERMPERRVGALPRALLDHGVQLTDPAAA